MAGVSPADGVAGVSPADGVAGVSPADGVAGVSSALPANVEAVRAEVSNWGRWGDDDQRGCANLLDAAAARRGAATVRTGESVSLAVPLGADGPQVGQPAHRVNPTLRMLLVNERDPQVPGVWVSSDDEITMGTCAGTHIDSLAHVAYDGLLWNGHPADSITEAGAARCGAEHLPAIVTRAILIDLPRLRGVAGLDEIDPGYAIGAGDLDEACAAAGLEVQAGDVVLLRTGEIRHLHAGNSERYALGDEFRFPGPSLDSVRWFRERDVAGVFTDSYAGEAFPPPSADWADTLCVHMLHIRDIGLLQGQNWDLETLGARCAAEARWDVFLVAAPEPIVGATSAPVAPVAIL